jgi:hypothetical protein
MFSPTLSKNFADRRERKKRKKWDGVCRRREREKAADDGENLMDSQDHGHGWLDKHMDMGGPSTWTWLMIWTSHI